MDKERNSKRNKWAYTVLDFLLGLIRFLLPVQDAEEMKYNLPDFECPKCNSLYQNIPGTWSGQKIKCSRCGNTFVVEVKEEPEQVKSRYLWYMTIIILLLLNLVGIYLHFTGKVVFGSNSYFALKTILAISSLLYGLLILIVYSLITIKNVVLKRYSSSNR